MNTSQLFDALRSHLDHMGLEVVARAGLKEMRIEYEASNELIDGYAMREFRFDFEGHRVILPKENEGIPIIKARFGIYLGSTSEKAEDNVDDDGEQPLGFYELDADINGEIIDDWFVLYDDEWEEDFE